MTFFLKTYNVLVHRFFILYTQGMMGIGDFLIAENCDTLMVKK